MYFRNFLRVRASNPQRLTYTQILVEYPPPGVYSHPYPRKNRPRQPSYLVYLKFDRISVSNTLLTPSPLTQLSYSKYKLQYTDARVSGSIRSSRYPQVNYASLFAIAP